VGRVEGKGKLGTGAARGQGRSHALPPAEASAEVRVDADGYLKWYDYHI
jgi:hypothetical protein